MTNLGTEMKGPANREMRLPALFLCNCRLFAKYYNQSRDYRSIDSGWCFGSDSGSCQNPKSLKRRNGWSSNTNLCISALITAKLTLRGLKPPWHSAEGGTFPQYELEPPFPALNEALHSQ